MYHIPSSEVNKDSYPKITAILMNKIIIIYHFYLANCNSPAGTVLDYLHNCLLGSVTQVVE